jgi:hypothetical protein
VEYFSSPEIVSLLVTLSRATASQLLFSQAGQIFFANILVRDLDLPYSK